MIRKLHAVAEVNLLPKGLGSWTKLQRVRKNFCANVASQIGSWTKCRTIFSQFWPQLSCFSSVFDP
jgi:hypothetical protein